MCTAMMCTAIMCTAKRSTRDTSTRDTQRPTTHNTNTQTHKMTRQTYKQKVADMTRRAADLESRGYTLLTDTTAPNISYGDAENIGKTIDMAVQSLCGSVTSDGDPTHAPRAIGGANINPNMCSYLDSIDRVEGTPEKGADGKPLGTKGLGYIRYGKDDRLPLHIYRACGSQPYSARAMAFNRDVVNGKGIQLNYHTVQYQNGTLKPICIPYADAGIWLEGQIYDVRKEIEAEQEAQQEQQPQPPLNELERLLQSEKNGSTAPQQYRTAAPPPPAPPSQSVNHDELGTAAYRLKRLCEEYDAWVDTNHELETFGEGTNLDEVFACCMNDDQHLDMSALVMVLNQGRVGSWDGKVTRIEHRPMTCVRLEQMDEQMCINYIYYSEGFLYDSSNLMRISDKNLVAYPLLATNGLVTTLNGIIAQNQKTKVKERQLEYAVINRHTCGFSMYYEQPAWWSIFSSLVFQYVSTMIYDKAIARHNSTMWGKLIYINNNYLQQYYADAGANTPEEKAGLRDKLVQSINQFLRERKNNGKTCTLDSFIAPGTNTVIRSIEIIDVPQPQTSTTKEDLEECANLIFWAMGVHTSLIASFGKNPSSGGTQQRELYALKQVMMSNRQRRFCSIINDIFRFNKWDRHLVCEVGREVLSTLDASKTGIVETNTNTKNA